MKIQTKLLLVVLLLAVVCTVPAVILYFRSVAFNAVFDQIPQTVNTVSAAAELNSVSQFIRYYDEVLTQSARNYAFTGDVYWKNRYNDAAPKLDDKIKEAIAKGTPEDKKIFESIDNANQALVDMETQSMALVDNNKKIEAQAILNSGTYSQQKLIYQNGLEAYVTTRGKGYNDTLTVSTQLVNDAIYASDQNLIINRWITILISFLCIAAAFVVYVLTRFVLFKPLEKITKATQEIAKGNLTYQIGYTNTDEIGILATSFDRMAKNLYDSHQDIEKKITQRTADLTKLNKFMTGRELKMMELKKEIEQLKTVRS